MAEWLKNHPEMYGKGKKENRDMDRKEATWTTQVRAMEGEFYLPLYYYLFII